MKRQLLIAFSFLFIINCSSHPEIKPYEPGATKTTDEELPYGQSISDSVFSDSYTMAANESDYDLEDASLGEDNAAEEPMATEPAPKKVVAPKATRSVASNSFKSGMYTFSANCEMKKSPSDSSPSAGQVEAGKKLWLDAHDSAWLKAYKKAGTVYVPAHCVN